MRAGCVFSAEHLGRSSVFEGLKCPPEASTCLFKRPPFLPLRSQLKCSGSFVAVVQ
ncbi:hypothetical protein M413DRAFT_446108 [Hebeloma cylindrosporum]|uniref:Uncharacterized protein n=1 Tax=Hebeloma cylindrosporum TaxID=76867 RepID=A0A0C3BVR3_HEBCY|nr:hypothetical protein M413DRAFT_446108 [Hebeloma cylindrosporum h7]